MKKVWFFILLVFMMWGAQNAHAAVKGLPFDDATYAHIGVSAYATKLCKSYGMGPLETAGVVLLMGVVKEAYDMKSTGWNNADIATNFVGFGLSYSVDFVLDI